MNSYCFEGSVDKQEQNAKTGHFRYVNIWSTHVNNMIYSTVFTPQVSQRHANSHLENQHWLSRLENRYQKIKRLKENTMLINNKHIIQEIHIPQGLYCYRSVLLVITRSQILLCYTLGNLAGSRDASTSKSIVKLFNTDKQSKSWVS